MTARALLTAIVGVLLVTAPAVCRADDQSSDLPDAAARMRVGVIRLEPIIVFNTGVDTNVFNASDQPSSDMVTTLSPKTNAWMRMGPARVSGTGSADFVYFQHATSERSINVDGSVKIALPLNRVEPYVETSFLRTRERPGIEIDARSLRKERTVTVGSEIRISGRSSLDLDATTSTVRFDAGAVFLETSLGEVLNRDDTLLRVALRHHLTPLTTLTVAAEATDDRFVESPVRNSRSVRIAPEIDFAATALITGRASIGYRAFNALDPSVPDFHGMVASIDLAYTLLGTTRFTFQANRDVDYSYETTAPYYVNGGVTAGIIQRLSDSTGITAKYGQQHLAYSALAGDGGDLRVDGVTTYGLGVIRKIGRDLRVTASLDYHTRQSIVPWREYNALRGGVAVTYGSRQ